MWARQEVMCMQSKGALDCWSCPLAPCYASKMHVIHIKFEFDPREHDHRRSCKGLPWTVVISVNMANVNNLLMVWIRKPHRFQSSGVLPIDWLILGMDWPKNVFNAWHARPFTSKLVLGMHSLICIYVEELWIHIFWFEGDLRTTLRLLVVRFNV